MLELLSLLSSSQQTMTLHHSRPTVTRISNSTVQQHHWRSRNKNQQLNSAATSLEEQKQELADDESHLEVDNVNLQSARRQSTEAPPLVSVSTTTSPRPFAALGFSFGASNSSVNGNGVVVEENVDVPVVVLDVPVVAEDESKVETFQPTVVEPQKSLAVEAVPATGDAAAAVVVVSDGAAGSQEEAVVKRRAASDDKQEVVSDDDNKLPEVMPHQIVGPPSREASLSLPSMSQTKRRTLPGKKSGGLLSGGGKKSGGTPTVKNAGSQSETVEYPVDVNMKEKLELLYAGEWLKKTNRLGFAQEKEFWMDKQLPPSLCWAKEGKPASEFVPVKGKIAMASIKDVQSGGAAKPLGFTIISSKRKINLEAPSTQVRDRWVEAVGSVSALYRGAGEASDDDRHSENANE
eukprot:TRINITY_DN16655_c0_g2_i2.p1 TRINITY_DN16655_c0_g2~~TRINITY_DN16655_c0_g2_i2.p1  ORF type:complete len:406 (-),score=134.45 TRINITY_DN16655_c0_g2_i2:57-1274(-)